MCGPIINLLGTEEQKAKYLPRLWRGDDLWCQLFSEPSAGSDVAGLRTKAEKVDGGWRITGSKVWTTSAQYCERGVIVARTDWDVPKHQGLTMFLIDMKAEGVQVNPLRVATGEKPFNLIFFDNVFVPEEDRLSELGKGWDAAVAMLRFERISIGTGSTRSEGPYAFDNVLAAAKKLGRTDEPGVRAALAELYVLEQGTSLLSLRMRAEAAAGIALNARGSIAKLAGAQANRRTAELVSEILGTALVSWSGFTPEGDGLYPGITAAFAGSASSWTAGGTMEVQKGIIGERVLGLEKDPQVDRGIPFTDIRQGA
jgi:alkylation response protein AidB-like acyl-CoA dehydrogenase